MSKSGGSLGGDLEDPATQYGLPQLEIVNEMEEDIYPQRTSHDSDYELSDTPYSSQNLGYMSQPVEMSPDKPDST